MTFFQFAYWAAIFFTISGAIMGLAGVWIKDFWKGDLAFRLIMTDIIFAGTALAVAAMTKWLGG